MSRVTMLWPSDLKESLRKKVGKRGLTEFVVSAVRQKIAAEQVESLKCPTCHIDTDENNDCWLCGGHVV